MGPADSTTQSARKKAFPQEGFFAGRRRRLTAEEAEGEEIEDFRLQIEQEPSRAFVGGEVAVDLLIPPVSGVRIGASQALDMGIGIGA